LLEKNNPKCLWFVPCWRIWLFISSGGWSGFY
jgi:hypothetical protein